ncbi:MAG: hypothetical protein ACOYVH_06205, partial [Spirochaetota bacterium]
GLGREGPVAGGTLVALDAAEGLGGIEALGLCPSEIWCVTVPDTVRIGTERERLHRHLPP